MITAKFGSKRFEVSPSKIYTPNGVSISEELNIEETEVSGKKPTITIKGVKPQALAYEVKLDSRFVDVEEEIQFWKSTLLAKSSKFFELGNRRIGRFYLTKYELKEMTINKNGIYTSAKISLSFTEDGEYANSRTINFESTKKVQAVKNSANK